MIVDTLGGICTLTFFLTCPFGQLTKKNTCTTQSFSCPQKIIIKIIKTMQRIIISNLCKMFWLFFHKHYLVVSLLILTDIMIMTYLIDKLTYFYFYQVMTYFNSLKIMSWELHCEKGRRREKKYNKKICTKQGVNLRIR